MEKTLGEDISLIGIGGCGCNMVNRQMEKEVCDNLFAVDIKKESPDKMESLVFCKIEKERKLLVTEDNGLADIKNWMESHIQTNKVLLMCALGGSSGNRLVTILAKAAYELEKEVYVLTYLPFHFESETIKTKAVRKHEELLTCPFVKYYAYFSNENLLQIVSKRMSLAEVLSKADEMTFQYLEENANRIFLPDVSYREEIPCSK